jgi:hypothetical protein
MTAPKAPGSKHQGSFSTKNFLNRIDTVEAKKSFSTGNFKQNLKDSASGSQATSPQSSAATTSSASTPKKNT